MKRLSPRRLTAIIAGGVALLGLAVVALNQTRRPALVVMEDDASNAPMIGGSQPGGQEPGQGRGFRCRCRKPVPTCDA